MTTEIAKGYHVEYRKPEGWKRLSDRYEDFYRAATIATALENRGFQTRIITPDDDVIGNAPN